MEAPAFRTRGEVRRSTAAGEAQALLDALNRRIERVNEDYLTAMGEHLRDIGTLTPSDVHRLEHIRRLRGSLAQITREIARAAGVSVSEVERVYRTIAEYDTRMASRILGRPDVHVGDSLTLQRMVRAQARETANTLRNFANTTIVSEPYRNAVDTAITAVQAGVEDYGTTIRRILRKAGGAGLRMEYASGARRRLDSAVRMNVLDGVRHLNQTVIDEIGREFGADGVEIDAHMLCAEDHLPYQGGQYTLEEFDDIQASLERPFGEWNCRHTWHPIFVGLSSSTYTQGQLDEMRSYSTEHIEIDGHTRTRYEWSQEMRRTETAVRQSKDTAILARATGERALERECNAEVRALNDHYRHIARESGLNVEFMRTDVLGFKDYEDD